MYNVLHYLAKYRSIFKMHPCILYSALVTLIHQNIYITCVQGDILDQNLQQKDTWT
jgi:hypothetical protein